MFFKLKYAACCLVLFATGMTWAQQVVATVDSRGDVTIKGTPNNDKIRILLGYGGKLAVLGDNDTWILFKGPLSWTVSSSIILPGTSSDSSIRFDMGGGDDSVRIYFDVNSVTCNLGSGRDSFHASNIDIARDLIVNAGAGKDSIFMEGVTARRNMYLSLGAGENAADSVESTRLINCGAHRNFSLSQSTGGSKHTLSNLYVHDSLRATFGSGLDVISASVSAGSAYVDLGFGVADGRQYASIRDSSIYSTFSLLGYTGRDEFTLENSYVRGRVYMNSGADDDSIRLSNSRLTGDISLDSGYGNDVVSLTNLMSSDVSGDVSVTTGVGDDELYLGVWEADTFNASLGSGDDVVYGDFMGYVNVFTESGMPRIFGGAGTDRFNALNDPDDPDYPLHLHGFENDLLPFLDFSGIQFVIEDAPDFDHILDFEDGLIDFDLPF